MTARDQPSDAADEIERLRKEANESHPEISSSAS